MKKIAALVMITSLLSACGSGVSGEYGSVNEINGKWDTLYTFKGDTVEMDMMGVQQVGTYKVEDGKVYITMGGQTHAMKIDDEGCIDGGPLLGKVCKKK